MLLVLQVASTSRGNSAPSGSRGGGSVGNATPHPVRPAGPSRASNSQREEERRVTTDGGQQVFAIREGEPLPEGFSLLVRATGTPTATAVPAPTVDLTTPPGRATPRPVEDVDSAKRSAAERRNQTRRSNREAHTSLVKEVKEALAEGRPPTVKVSERPRHLKARWHAAAKEVAYKFLDLTKESWKSYSTFEKTAVRKEIDLIIKCNPPLEPHVVDKYLAGHLRSARAVWKAHWSQHGDDARHPNCPEAAWESLIKWWATDACKEEAAAMAHRRSKVANSSRTGRKALVDRMDEQVRRTSLGLHALLQKLGWLVCTIWGIETAMGGGCVCDVS